MIRLPDVYKRQGEGRKQSKSLGNVNAPSEVIDEYGADILRLWVASSDYHSDVRVSTDIIKQLAEVYRDVYKRQVTNLLTASDSGVVTDLDGSVNELTVLLNKKQVVTGKVDNFSERIAYLEKERDYQKSTISSGFTQFNSPQTGYFVHTLDGAEGLLSSENMESIPVEEYQKLVEREFTPDDSKIGKVIRSHNWYLAVPIEAKDLGRCRIGAKVDMDFHLTQLRCV